MTWPRLALLGVTSWALLTAGLTMAFHSWAVVPLSSGLALGAVCYVYARAAYIAALEEKEEDKAK